MRFIRQEEIITTICNEEVSDEEHICRVLKKLKEEGLYFSLSIKKMFQSDYQDHIMSYNKVKVKEVREEENKVDFMVYKDSSLIILNGIAYSEVSEIFAMTKKNNILNSGKDKGIFDFIDLE